MMLWKLQVKLKAKRFSLNASILLSQVNPEIKSENVVPDGLSYRLSDKIFTTFPEALINAEGERIYDPNSLFITFVICFSASFNAEYVSTGTSLSTSAIKSDTMWSPLMEPTE